MRRNELEEAGVRAPSYGFGCPGSGPVLPVQLCRLASQLFEEELSEASTEAVPFHSGATLKLGHCP